MKITKLPDLVDPTDQIVQSVLDMPVNAFVMAHGDLYRINSPYSVDLMLRTGQTGFVVFPLHCGLTGLDKSRVYHGPEKAESWVRAHLRSGATISIIDPNAEA